MSENEMTVEKTLNFSPCSEVVLAEGIKLVVTSEEAVSYLKSMKNREQQVSFLHSMFDTIQEHFPPDSFEWEYGGIDQFQSLENRVYKLKELGFHEDLAAKIAKDSPMYKLTVTFDTQTYQAVKLAIENEIGEKRIYNLQEVEEVE